MTSENAIICRLTGFKAGVTIRVYRRGARKHGKGPHGLIHESVVRGNLQPAFYIYPGQTYSFHAQNPNNEHQDWEVSRYTVPRHPKHRVVTLHAAALITGGITRDILSLQECDLWDACLDSSWRTYGDT